MLLRFIVVVFRCLLINVLIELNIGYFRQTIPQASVESYDFVRTARMAGYGLLILGPTLHYWFNLMSRLFPKRDLITTFKKMAMGQTVYGPAMNVVFFSLNAALQGKLNVCLKRRKALSGSFPQVMIFLLHLILGLVLKTSEV